VSERATPRRRPAALRCLRPGKCATPPCLHAEPVAALTTPLFRAQPAGAPPSPAKASKPRDRRRHTAKSCHLVVYPSPMRLPGQCPCAARIRAAVSQSLHRSRPFHVGEVAATERAAPRRAARRGSQPPRWAARPHTGGPRAPLCK
jgi:hypothetical protein